MDILKSFYLRFARVYAVLLAVLGITVGEKVIPFLNNQINENLWVDFLIKFVTSTIPYTLLYFGGEYIIRQYLWKFKFYYRYLDLSGQWVGISYYTHIEIETESKKKLDFKEESSMHYVNIHQDCLEIKIQSSPGNDFVSWASNAANLTNDGSLKFAYEVKYGNERKLSSKGAKGYEEMKIIKKNESGLPILLSGEFSHCADGSKPIYRGKTLFVRKEFLNEINLEFIDEDFKLTIQNLKDENK